MSDPTIHSIGDSRHRLDDGASGGAADTLDAAEQLRHLLGTLAALHSARDVDSGLQLLADRLRQVIPYDNCAVLLLDERGRDLRFAMARGYEPEVVEHWHFGLGQGLVGTVARTERALRVDDVSDDPRYLAAAPGTRSELALPLRAGGRVIGVLDVGSRQPGFLTARHQHLLELLTDCVASWMHGRTLFQNLQDQSRMLSVLHEVTRELTAILDRKQLMERVAERLAELLHYDVFTLFLWNDEDRVLDPWLWIERNAKRQGVQPLRLGEGISGNAATLRQIVRVANTQHDPRHVTCDPSIEVRSEMAVPIVLGERLVGVLDFESLEYDHFRNEHEQLVATLAPTLAIALGNAELVERLEEKQRRLDRDLSTARKVQRQLLPLATPHLPGVQLAASWEPARDLGGDFYDFLTYEDGRIVIAVGDVAGKATSAALYAALTVGMLREIASHSQLEPAALLRYLNERLIDVAVEHRFVAMTIAVYDAGQHRLQIANAGLPYPFLLRGRRLTEIELGGIPLGQLRQADYQQTEIRLSAGDTVVVVSDGITEARCPEEGEFGESRLNSTLQRLAAGSPRDVTDGLLEAVRQFSRGAEAIDDRTAVALRCCGDCLVAVP